MKNLLSSITLILLSTLAFGQVPNTFSSGETISSSKINANFSYLANAMAAGNVVDIMLCKNIGLTDKDNPSISHGDNFISPVVTYYGCLPPDNTTVIPSTSICTINSLNNGFCQNGGGISNAIIATDLISNGWIYYDYNSIDAFHLFYKVSSD